MTRNYDNKRCAQIVCALRFMIAAFETAPKSKQQQAIYNEAIATTIFTPDHIVEIANELEDEWEKFYTESAQ